MSQMFLVIRYLYQNVIHEDFVQFVDVYESISSVNEYATSDSEFKATGINLGRIVLKTLKELNLNIKDCIGITTDGCSIMTSEVRGAVVTIQEKAENTIYSPCHNHILNLSIFKSSSIQSVKNPIGVMKETISFLEHQLSDLVLRKKKWASFLVYVKLDE